MTYNIESIQSATRRGGSQKVLFPDWAECKEKSEVIRSGSVDLLKSSVERVSTLFSSIAGRNADRVDAHFVRTKTTH